MLLRVAGVRGGEAAVVIVGCVVSMVVVVMVVVGADGEDVGEAICLRFLCKNSRWD